MPRDAGVPKITTQKPGVPLPATPRFCVVIMKRRTSGGAFGSYGLGGCRKAR